MFPFESIAYAQSAGRCLFTEHVFSIYPAGFNSWRFLVPDNTSPAKKQKAHQRMVDSLNKGDKVVTNGGIFGTIVKVGDDRITLEVASKVHINLERQQVSRMDIKSSVKQG